MDLHAYSTVGLVTFIASSSAADAELQRQCTQQFLQQVEAAQPGTRVIELGREAEVLASVHRGAWDAQTLRAVKEMHGVDAIVLGRLDVTKAKPKVNLSTASLWSALDLRVNVTATHTARLLETSSGATMWTDSSKLTTTLADANVSKHSGSIGIRDRDSAYGGMVDQLVCDVTDAFRVHYVTRTVPNDQPDTATGSAGD
jgi:hypothetical protein